MVHTTLQSNDQFNQTIFFSKGCKESKHSLVITLLFKVSHSCKQCGTNLVWIFRNKVIMVEKKLSRITVYSEVYDTILHSKVVYRAITHRKPHKPDIPRVFCVILSRRNCFTGTMYCYFSGNHRSTNSKHRECAFIYTCNNQSSRSDIVRIFGRIHWGRIFNECT